MVAYRACQLDAMLMPLIGELMVPVAGWPTRGSRYARATRQGANQPPVRNIRFAPANRLDTVPIGTNRNDNQAETAVITIYGRTRLRIELRPDRDMIKIGEELTFRLETTALLGTSANGQSFARMISPAIDVRKPFSDLAAKPPRTLRLRGSKDRLDAGLAPASLQERNPEIGAVRDVELEVVTHDNGAPHIHAGQPDVPGGYYLGVFISGAYCPDHGANDPAEDHDDHDDHSQRRRRRRAAMNTTTARPPDPDPAPI